MIKDKRLYFGELKVGDVFKGSPDSELFYRKVSPFATNLLLGNCNVIYWSDRDRRTILLSSFSAYKVVYVKKT